MKHKSFFALFLLILMGTQLCYADFFQNLEIFQRKNTTSNIAYGSDALQKLDVYLPKSRAQKSSNQTLAPILLIVHGGAWSIGDKGHQGLIQHKADYWNKQGWVVISVNYRLVPNVTVQQQTQDIADALNFVQKNASNWQANPQKIMIMGHSAGAHLVSLLSTHPKWISSFPQPWKATIALDSAAYDVEAIMSNPHAQFYDRVFGAAKENWHLVSPKTQLKHSLPAFLAVCSTIRPDQPCVQAHSFIQQAKALGASTAYLPLPLSHAEINRNLGQNNDYTRQVDQFMQQHLKH
ncbi:alpha/beta hydrolase [Acinetobacter sp. PS-1]|nr:alpha/beta hydrolase [Acinetobacter kanungonis]